MVSARSTVSIARTTPAQKPRGEQSTILRGGLIVGIEAASDRVGPKPKGSRSGRFKGINPPKDLGRLSGPVKGTHCVPAPGKHIRSVIPVIVDDHGFASRRWAKRKGDLP